MNRIYKVIWSAVRNTYVAVAETTHAHGKAHSTKQQIFAALAAGMLVVGGINGSAYAAEGKVLAGVNNTASGDDASVSGGNGNTASGDWSSISGGSQNTASGNFASVSGGSGNTASESNASVSGGSSNAASGSFASVSGGSSNTASGVDASVSGGDSNTASGSSTSVSGGHSNTASGAQASISGGFSNTASGNYSSVSGGSTNTASGACASVSGGYSNMASGNDASVSGGNKNTASGTYASVNGGDSNIALGNAASVSGGSNNVVLSQYAASFGGENGVAQGYGSVIIGGSTGTEASDSVAIGPSSVVTVMQGTAVGYQSTTNQSGTIAFGHDKDDVSGYTVTWQQRTDKDSEGNIVKNADGTTNDYTKAPKVTENTYTSSYYNRLVKVADGKSAHDVATVGQTVELVAGDHVKVEADTTATNTIGQQRKKISILTDGKIEKGNTGLVTGDAIYTALNAETTARQNADTTLTNQLTTTNKNVSDLQTAIKQKADASTVYTKTEVDSQVSGLKTDLAGKADASLSNLTDAGKTAVKDIMKTDLSQKADKADVYMKTETYNRTEVDDKVNVLTNDLAGKADTSLSNLTDAGKAAVKDIMKSDLDKKANQADVYTKTEVDSQVSNLNTSLSGKADTSLSNLTDTGRAAVKDIMKSDLDKKVNQADVYTKTEVDSQVSSLNTNLAGKADASLSNLTDAGKAAVKDIMQSDLDKKANQADVYTKTEVDSQVSNLNTSLSGKADASLSNLTDAGKATVKGIMKDDLAQKADKSTVYTKDETYNRGEIDGKVSGLTTDIAGKADTSLSNLTDAGKTAVKAIMKDDLSKKADVSTVYTKTEVDSQVNGLKTDLSGKADASLSNLTDAGKTAVKNIMKDDLAQKVDKSAANLSADDVKNWQDKLGNGNIARGDHGLISGGKVFEALQGVGNYGLVKSDGKVVNIAKDDSAKVIDVSGAGTNRVITGVKTDVRDPSSAANVAYVNGNTQQIYQDMNQAYGSLRNDISRAAASSNALAALKPMEFDSDDKLQFGIGYGHYHNANAAAVGAFYQPDENCMMNLGASIGNGNPGVSAGITIKFGPGGSGAPMLSKRQMAKIIQNQSVQLDEQSKEIESLKQENQEMKEQLKAILDKLNK